MRGKGKAQSLLEYSILIGVAVAAILAMRTYVLRGVQEKYRQSVDVFGQGGQYEKGITQITDLDGPGIPPVEPPVTPIDTCPTIQNKVTDLEKQVADLRSRAADFDTRAAQLEEQAQVLISQGLIEEANQLLEMAAKLRSQAEEFRNEANTKEDQIEAYKQGYPECFPSAGP